MFEPTTQRRSPLGTAAPGTLLGLAILVTVGARPGSAQEPAVPPAPAVPAPAVAPASGMPKEGVPQAAPPPAAATDAPVGPPMALGEAVTYAAQNNPRISEAAARVRQARALVAQRRAVRGPQVGADAFILRQGPEVGSTIPGAAPAVPPWRWDIGVALSQILFDWNRRASDQRAAQKAVEAEGSRQAETANDVRLVVSSTFYNVLRARQLLAVAEERRNSAAEQLRVTRARYESDVAPRFDVIRSEAELANAEQDVIAAQNDLALAESSFNIALGRDVATPVNLAYDTQAPRPAIPFQTAREAALQHRPQLAALRSDVASGQELVRSRRAENKPQISLSAGYDRLSTSGFQKPDSYSAGLVMSFPFFDNGLTRGRVREAQGAVDVSRSQLEQARQQVELEVRQAQLDIDEASKRIGAAQIELRSAREALRVAQVRYRSGVGTNIEVTDAQVAVARAGQNVANAEFDYQTGLARLESATGVSIDTLMPAVPGGAAAPANPGPSSP